MSLKGLKKEHREFVSRYLKGFNATMAYLETYPDQDYNTASTSASELLKIPKIMKAVDLVLAARLKRLDLNADKVLQGYMAIAFCDVRQFFDKKGKLKPLNELNIIQQAAIDSIETEHLREQLLTKTKIKFNSRQKALDSLAKHLGVLKDFGGQVPGANVNVNVYPDRTVVFQDARLDDKPTRPAIRDLKEGEQPEHANTTSIHASEGTDRSRVRRTV